MKTITRKLRRRDRGDYKITTVPEPGHTVQLTIDSAFQRAWTRHWPDNIEMINRTYNSGIPQGCRRCGGGHQHEGRQCAGRSNYPSYDQNLFATIQRVQLDPSLPLLNRALQGLYTPAPPSSLRWRWRRWTPASSTALPPSTATVSKPIMTTTAPSVPATATAATSTSSRPSSGAATSSSTMWAAAPPVTSTTPTPTRWALVPAPARRSTRLPAA